MQGAHAHQSDRWRRPLSLDFDEFGDPSAPPVILLVGLGMQRFEWPEHLIRELSRTHRVICPDNRDAGRSPICGPESEPTFGDVWLRRDQDAARQIAPYLLEDMRDDVVALVDRLGIDKFDIVGFSMGGMISQTVAIALSDRVKNFVQLASNDGSAEVDSDEESKRRMARLFSKPSTPESTFDHILSDALYYGAGQLQDTAELRAEINEIVAQGYQFGGAARHGMAVLASPDRRNLLPGIRARTLVIHGDHDPCISVERGRGAAALIPDAQLSILSGAGHIITGEMCRQTLDWLTASPS